MKHRILFAFLLSSLCPLCLCGESLALDAEAKTPYQLKVVLHFADHRLLTDVFRDRVERELHDDLQGSFGDLVIVETTRAPKLDDVLPYGLKSLDGWKERSAVKSHFVLIDYTAGQYEIQARQFDGLMGQPSPLVRRDWTRDPEFVAKAAALLIEEDFGLVGVFDRWPAPIGDTNEDQSVALRLKGSGLGMPLDRWIQKGDVFAVVQMPAGDAGPGKPILGALLMVDKPPAAGDAACMCRVFRRYDPPRDSGAGYRCIKLGTIVRTPLRLRFFQALADNRVGALPDQLTVDIRRNGFVGEDAAIQKGTNDDGAVDTIAAKENGLFDHVAFVNVLRTGLLKARVPIALLDEQPVVLAVNVASDPNSLRDFRRTAWERDVDTAWREQVELFREINDLAADPNKRDEARKKIQDALDRSQDDGQRLAAEKKELEKDGAFSSPAADDRLNKIKEGAADLSQFLDKLKKIDAEENDPKRKVWRTQVEEAKRLDEQLEIDKALALYDQVLKEGYQDEALKAYVDKLHKEWVPKGEEHRNARAFLYEVWPTLDDAGLKDQLKEAAGAVETCKAVGDWRAVTKFVRSTDAHFVRMKQEADKLRPDINVDDEKPSKLIKDVSDALTPIFNGATRYLKTRPK
ncbi:MAG TPA: hypothetical protein VMS17_30595 [Gemmataceae bacterium]|nr:hypothetical protein [Gemmataceae bacterium]